jgi:hypothetical protein
MELLVVDKVVAAKVMMVSTIHRLHPHLLVQLQRKAELQHMQP